MFFHQCFKSTFKSIPQKSKYQKKSSFYESKAFYSSHAKTFSFILFYGFHETKSYDLIIIFNFPLLST